MNTLTFFSSTSDAHFLSVIDWQQPWLAPLRACGLQLAAAGDWRHSLNTLAAERGIRNHKNLAITFVPQAALPQEMAYEAFISEAGQVPTRENLHDFFNALIWLSFPATKSRLNALQAAELAKAGTVSGSGKPRGAARDAATIFDENAALLVVQESTAGEALITALRTHQWQSAFVQQRAMFGADAEVWLFGHALIEKLVRPYKAITAHTLVLSAPDAFFAWDMEAKRVWIDQQVVAVLKQGIMAKQLTPLPVLGVPNWCVDQNEAFYADISVFRPKRVVIEGS